MDEFNSAMHGSLTLQTGKNRQGIGYAMAQNPTYVFRITRSTDVVPYSIDYLEQVGHFTSAFEARAKQVVAEARGRPLNTWYFFSEPLDVVIQDPAFRVSKAFDVERDGAKYVRVDFEYSHPGDRARDFTQAFVLLDPEHHWAIKEFGATQPDSGAVHHGTVSFGETVNGFPIPRTVKNRISPKNDPESVLQIAVDVETSAEDVSDAVFYLSHYGLPEPNFSRSWMGSWILYLIGGVICLGIGAITIRRRSYRA